MKKISLLCAGLLVSLLASALEVNTTFNAQSADGKRYVLDSVKMENVSRGWSRTLDCTTDTTFAFTVKSAIPTGIEDLLASSSDNGLIANYRNLNSCHIFTINVNKAGMVSVRALDMSGKIILTHEQYCIDGAYQYQMSISYTQQPFILSVSTTNRSAAMVLLNMESLGNNTITCEEVTPLQRAPLYKQETYDISEGDQISFVGYSHRQGEVIISETVNVYQSLTDDFITLIFEPAQHSNEGVYVGLMGFNNQLRAYPIGLFGSSNLSQYNDFIDACTTANGTILAHAVYSALDSLELSPIPDKLADVTLVVFTDGLENASWRMRPSVFHNSADYMQAVSDRIGRMWIDGTPLTSYSIGIKGSDVSDEVRFANDLRSLASDSGCVYYVKDMNEVKKKFRDIASKIRNSHTSYSLSLSIPAQEPGSRIRLTFDNVNDAALSEYYIEGTYDFDYDNFYATLTDVAYCGVTSTNGSSLTSVPDGIFDVFTIDNLMNNLGQRVNVSNIQQWYYIQSSGKWQVNSEFTPASGVTVTEERNSAIVMLVLDCSSSLGSDFASVQSNAKEFLTVLTGQTSFSKPSVSSKSPVLGKLSATCGGTITNDGGLTIFDKGICLSKYSNMDSVRYYSSHSETEDFDVVIEGLTEGQTYYYYAYARNNAGMSYGAKRQFTAIDYYLATVQTISASTNDYTTASVNGQVLSTGNQDVTERGVCYSTSPNPTVEDTKVAKGTGLGSFTCSLSGLEAGTTYYVRAYAINSVGIAYGDELNFTTKAYTLPTVTTSTSWTVNYTSASGSGTVNTTGGAAVTERGVCYATHPTPTIEDNKVVQGTGTGSYSVTLSGLEEGTTYYVRAFATSVAGTGYGEECTFKTKGSIPTVSFSSIGTPTATSVTCTGNVSSNGGVTLIERGFCYSVEPEPTIGADHLVVSGTSTGSFSGTLTELAVNTTYYVRAYATNKLGVSYSDQRTFTTANGLPTVTTNTSPTVTATSITAGGNVTANGGFDVTERGICYSSTNSVPTISDGTVASGAGNGTFSVTATGLSASTQYYLRAYATNENGTTYGSVITATTQSGTAALTLGTISNVGPVSATSTVKVTSVNGASLLRCGLCWSTSENPTIEDSIVVATGTTLNSTYTCNISGLRPSTTYYVRAFATTDVKTSYSTAKSFTTANGLATVTTNTSPTVTATSITAGGNVTANGGFDVTERGICYSSTNSTPTIADGKVDSGTGNGTFSVTATGLSASTQYYLRAYATNENGTTYGSVITATTQSGAATLSIGTITNIKALSASGKVTITAVYGASIQSCGLCWSTSQTPTIDDDIVIAEGIALNTTYTCEMSELQPNTTYYVRAFATTEVNTSYSTQKSFTTPAGLPNVTTGTNSSTATNISISGNITDNGGYDITERGVCYSSMNENPTIADSKIISQTNELGEYNILIADLTPSTTYYVRTYASNIVGTAYDAPIQITTQSGAAELTLGNITNIKALSASTNIIVTKDNGASLQSCGICWSTSPNPTIEGDKIAASGKELNTSYICEMSELQPNTLYYVRAYAITDVTTSYSTPKSFTTPSGLPSLLTGTPVVTATSITITVNVPDNGGYTINSRGVCYSRINTNPTIVEDDVIQSNNDGTVIISGLEPLTTYYVRSYATNIVGTIYSNVYTITTKSGAAVCSLGTFSNIRAYSVSNTIVVSDTDGASLEACGLCWSTNENPTIEDNVINTEGNSLNMVYTCEMTGLQENTTYYVRAFAKTNITTTYSAQKIVSTAIVSYPTVSLSSRTVVSSSSVNCIGNVSFDGNVDITERGFCWGLTSNPTTNDNSIAVAPGSGEFSGTLTGLEEFKTYYIRAYAKNQKGISYSGQSSVYISTLTYSATSKLSETTNTSSAGLHTNAFGVNMGAHIFNGGQGIIAFDGQLTTIGAYAFYQCTGMSSISIPSCVTSFGNYCFGGCTGLTAMTIPNSVNSIGDYCFAGCISLNAMTIPNSVTRIGLAAFGRCNFASITIPNSVTDLGGGYTFINCTRLTNVSLPDNMTTIADGIFGGCTSLTTINMASNITSIGSEAFTGCSKLPSITIPSTVSTIGNNAFYNCSSLLSVTINSNTIVSAGYANTSGLQGIFGSQVTSYTIGSGVTSIGNYAFAQCTNLKTVTIPNTVTNIGAYAFSDCTGLTSITCRATTPPTCSGTRRTYVFNNVPRNIPVYVPSSAISKYQSVLGWQDFTNYKAL